MTDLISISFLALSLALAGAIIARHDIRPDKPGLLAIVLLVAGAVLAGPSPWSALPLSFLPAMLAGLLLVPAVAITRSFGRIDMIAILFHQDFGFEGASLAGIRNEITTGVLAATVALLSLLGLNALAGSPALLLPGATVVMLAANPILRHGLARLPTRPKDSDLANRLVDPPLAPSEPLPDILIVYLEGTDRRFADTRVFGQTYAGLAEFAAEGLSLTRIGQVAGTNWSVAGMTASQAGVPILPRGFQFKTGADKLSRFMPDLHFLGDHLAALGYERHFLVGNEADFAGTGAMYRTHCIPEITSGKTVTSLFPPDEVMAAQVSWFMDDQMVLDAARKVHARLAPSANPIALIVETIGPHGPKGCLSRRWTTGGKAEETHDIAHSVECLTTEVLELVEDLRAATVERRRQLRVVLLSDHLNHTPSLAKAGPEFEGYNTAILWGDPRHVGKVIDRPASMMDLYPTLLDWLGWSPAPVAAGLGRSLLSAPQTLVEEFGLAGLDAMLVSDARLAARLWADGGKGSGSS